MSTMQIVGLATESPSTRVSAAETAAFLSTHVPRNTVADLRQRVLASGIRQRSALAPLDRLAQLGTIDQRNALYIEHAVPLAERVARRALERAGVPPERVAVLVFSSSTGVAVPTLEARVASALGLDPAACCVAVTGTGCAGALRAMGLAERLLTRGGDGVALVVAVELCSLWLQVCEPSPEDIEANMVFADGAAAVVLEPGPVPARPELIACQSVRWPDSIEMRGARLTATGFRHCVSPRLPHLLARHLPRTVTDFLAARGLRRSDVAIVAVNPSDRAISHAAARLLDLPSESVSLAAHVWANHGNTLSVGPLQLLRVLADSAPADGALGLLIVIGPGITCDLLLVRWNGALPSAHIEPTVSC